MCGLVGATNQKHTKDLSVMLNAVAHRGPDGSGLFEDNHVALGHVRLSIVDQAGGNQPMQSVCGRYVLVYNGEVFNAQKLRDELEAEGVQFLTHHSDTEVLLNLLIQKGEQALPKINGMFAFAFYDVQRRIILCARDRFGIKPFYYARPNGDFVFASELKSLLCHPKLSREPDLQNLFHYFSLQYLPGEGSAISGVEQLAPGSCLTFHLDSRHLENHRWWSPAFTGSLCLKSDELIEYLRDVIGEAVNRWSISDVPVGCLLSGGLDSSTIVSLLAQRGHQLKTYTVGFSGPGEEAWDELKLAAKIAQKYGTDHHEIILDPEDLLDDLVEMAWYLDEPYGGGLPSWSVFKAMSGEVKVAMTGIGGDELFGNYNKYVRMEGRYRSRLPGLARRNVDKARFDREWFAHYSYAGDLEKHSDILQGDFAGCQDTADMMWRIFCSGADYENVRDRVVRLDLSTQLPNEFLMMTDRFSMAHSIEARTPMLDHKLAEVVYSIPSSTRLSPNQYKPLLRRVLEDMVPHELMKAPKQGFVIPLKLWLKSRLRPVLERLFAPARLRKQGIIRDDFLQRYVVPHTQGKRDYTNRIWTMLMFQLWWDLYINQVPLADLKALVRGEL